MDTKKMRSQLEQRLTRPEWEFTFDREKDTLRIENRETKKGVTVALSGIIAKWHEEKDKAIDEVVYYIEESLTKMHDEHVLTGKEKNIYPVIRSTSFPTETKEGKALLFDNHTAETRVYYALDLGTTYRLIDKELLQKEEWNVERVKEVARFNIRSLEIKVKEDIVADNTFYFINTNDGYDASRILNETYLHKFSEKINGTMAVAVPHQDVLIIADIQNDTGYDVLAHMTMSFFASGRVPITALSFLYENGELEPIFILGKNKRK
ncbi:DUF1444 domain-containing protein [Cytobacillus sp. S13-E01]|uniref:DUF1444 domain-containing protein n=1 Tax=Cytobacillus sp. S13-E01 TaxID=3031326 RepID=UPI0023D83C76|nr:DUF1444 domain-containing protein [Cytobacillus sp. S13-E01]MDF0726461.1 DUF1444 domain-containing protein [Cytobacillus sp. S13-E01]